jgi:DNA-directed RNA polymerase specialized sigma24 family protein
MGPLNAEEPGSVTRWISGLQRGDQEAIQALWEHYFEPLARIAQARLRGAPCRAGDGEDIAVEAFLSFCSNAQTEGRFPELFNRDNLMRLLVRFTVCKAFDFCAREGRRHRAVRGESALGEAGFECLPGDEPPAGFQAQVADLLAKLPTEDLREIARLRMEGSANREIASARKCSVATIERKLAHIRGYWKADWADLRGREAEEGTTS